DRRRAGLRGRCRRANWRGRGGRGPRAPGGRRGGGWGGPRGGGARGPGGGRGGGVVRPRAGAGAPAGGGRPGGRRPRRGPPPRRLPRHWTRRRSERGWHAVR